MASQETEAKASDIQQSLEDIVHLLFIKLEFISSICG